jgi:HD-GYP domain-containing protein (c-di-GMP phosphodiesterase class II)
MTGVVSVYRDITPLVEAQERAQHMVNQTIQVFVHAIEAVDPYLRGQSTYTGVLAVALAREINKEGHEDTLRTAANLSQIGMIQLPRKLISKTDKLTPDERIQLEKHVEYAKEVLKGIDFGLPVLEAIVQMHERLDGSGYPSRLQGDAIGLDARILAVANTFCAILRPRSYRMARTLEEAMDILSVEPFQYDPEVVQALNSYLQTESGQEFFRELRKTD